MADSENRKIFKNLGHTFGRKKKIFPVAASFDHFEKIYLRHLVFFQHSKNILTSDFSSRNKRLSLGYERELRLRLVALTHDFGCYCISVELGRPSMALGPWCPWHWREEDSINKPNLPLSTPSPHRLRLFFSTDVSLAWPKHCGHGQPGFAAQAR